MRLLKMVLLALLSPLAEKNPIKAAAVDAPFVFSMSRCIVAAFAVGMYQQIQHIGIAGWPEATLCIALAYTIPILNVLDRAKPAEVLAFGKTLLARFGEGAVRQVGALPSVLPSKDDDERGTEGQ